MNRFTPNLETLDERINLSASPQPVMMVIANQQDFYYKEYAEVAPSTGGANFLLGDGSVRSVKDDIAAKPTDPQAAGVVFVGGWGSSMYQYG
jgi:prepilin-type processing-associated H-X9-DG protein